MLSTSWHFLEATVAAAVDPGKPHPQTLTPFSWAPCSSAQEKGVSTWECGSLDDVPIFSDSKDMVLPLLTRDPLLFILGQPLSPGKTTGKARLRNQTGLMWRCYEGVIFRHFSQKQSLANSNGEFL